MPIDTKKVWVETTLVWPDGAKTVKTFDLNVEKNMVKFVKRAERCLRKGGKVRCEGKPLGKLPSAPSK